MTSLRRSGGALLLVAAVAFATAAQAAEEAASFYLNRTVVMTISYGAGGGYDFYGRLVARHMAAHLAPGAVIVVKNMSAAGGLAGANHLYNIAPRDGSAIGVINQNAALGQVLGAPGIQYDARRFAWLGRMASGVEVSYAWHTAPAKTIAEAKRQVLVIGGSGPTSTSEVLPRVMNQLLGTKFKLVSGYSDGEAGMLALERGEIDAYSTAWAVLRSRNADWLRDGKVSILVQYGLERAPDLPDIPTSLDLADNPEDRQVFALFASGNTVGRALLAPPELPVERVALLRSAFDAAVRDPKLLAEARTARYDLDPLPGARLQQIVEGVFDVSPAVVAKAAALSTRTK